MKLLKEKKYIHIFLAIVVAVAVFVGGYAFGSMPTGDFQQVDEKLWRLGDLIGKGNSQSDLAGDVNFQEFWNVWKYVQENYVNSDVTDKQLFYGALSGLVSALEDPYSLFLRPDLYQKFEQELSGSFEGIGAEIGIRQDQLQIVAPLPGTPADRAGLLAGDFILAIDGQATLGLSVDEAVSKIRGEKGTQVVLTIARVKEDPKDVSITRDTIEIDSVRFVKENGDEILQNNDEGILIENKYAYIQLLYFNENTLTDWNETINALLKKNPEGIILDLRGNPGGFLVTAIEIAGEWVNGDIVVREKMRNGEEVTHKANRTARLQNIPTVVLVDEGSASGAEILAGAIQDYKLGTLVGEKTFGKGSVQDLRSFSDGSAVKLTIAEWLTPNGRNINKEGIMPDIEVERTIEDFNAGSDPQLDKALEIIKAQ